MRAAFCHCLGPRFDWFTNRGFRHYHRTANVEIGEVSFSGGGPERRGIGRSPRSLLSVQRSQSKRSSISVRIRRTALRAGISSSPLSRKKTPTAIAGKPGEVAAYCCACTPALSTKITALRTTRRTCADIRANRGRSDGATSSGARVTCKDGPPRQIPRRPNSPEGPAGGPRVAYPYRRP